MVYSRTRQGISGSISGIRAVLLRYFDWEGIWELGNSQNNSLAMLPILQLARAMRVGNKDLEQTPESGPSTVLKMTVPSTTEEKISRFGGNDATKKTQKALLKQQYENFNATSSESLDSIFNRLQKVCDATSLCLFVSLLKHKDLNLFMKISSKFMMMILRDGSKKWNYGLLFEYGEGRSLSETGRILQMCAIDGGGFDWSDMAEDEVQANMALMAFTDFEVSNDKTCSKNCLQNYEALKKQDRFVWKRKYRSYGLLMGFVKTELENVTEVTDKNKRGFGYNAVPSPHPLILNRPTPLDLSYSESNNSKENTDDSLTQQPKTVNESSSVVSSLKVDKDWKEKIFHPANHIRVEEPKEARENNDAPIIEDWVSDDEEEVESIPKEEKKANVPIATKKESVKPVSPSRRSIRYAEMYRSQRPRGNQRSWNGQKSHQLGVNFVFNNKACFICGNFDHFQYNCPNAYKHMVPRAVLMRTGLKTVKNAKPLSTARSVNTVRPVSTARFVNTVRPYNTAHPKPTVSCARPKTHFQNQAQRPFYKNTALTKRSNIQNINTARQAVNTVRPNVNTVRARGFNAVKPSACWSNYQLNEKGFVDSGCSRHMSGNIAHLSEFKEFDGGYVTFGGGANGGRITGKGTIKTDKLDFEDVYFVKELKFNLFSVSQMCDKKNYVLFTDSECLVLSPNFKLPDESQVLLKIPRQNNMYSFDMKNIVPKDGLTCLVAKATSEESMLWHRRLGHVNFKNINKLVKDNLNDNGTEFKNHVMDEFCREKGIKREYSVARTPQQNGVAERKNSKAFRVYNIRTRKVQENLHVGFLENKPMLEGNGPKWLFDLDSLTQTMNYVPVVAGTFSNVSTGMQEGSESNISSQKDQDCIFMPIWKDASYFEDIIPQSVDDVQLQGQDGTHDDSSFQEDGIDDHQVNTASPQVNTASPQVNTGSRELSTADYAVSTATSEGLMGPIPTTEDSQEEDQGIDLGNLSPSYAVSTTPHTRIHKETIQ
ncbi:ribonuclease H-like domain-containing protein [Tanacetum coccineum]